MSDVFNNHGPEPETPESEQYLNYARREIISVLEEVAENNLLLTVYFNQGEEHFVTNLLQINPEFEELVFDAAPSDAVTARLLQSKRSTFVTFIDQIKVQFHAQHIEPTTFEGGAALRMRLPDSVMRLQRRNFFRVPTPRGKPLVCEVPVPGGKTTQFTIRDLSVGGMALIAGPAQAAFAPGMVIHKCRIDLPDHGNFDVSLEIRNNKGPATTGAEAGQNRYGCQFLNLPGPVVSLVQRYINQLERARRAMA